MAGSLFTIAGNVAGPLPLNIPFTAPLDGPVTLMFSGTAWSQTANVMIGVNILLDGNLIGTSQLFSNLVAEHKTLPAQLITADLGEGQHTLRIVALNSNTATDFNDNFSVWLLV